jgi:DNA-binding transcriptional ArsR family regulator
MNAGHDTLDLTLAALADPTRRAILSELARRESRITHLAEPFAVSLNAISKHVKVLERAGLVSRRIVGRDHVLTYNPAPMDEAEAWIEAQKALWSWRLKRLGEALDEQEITE